MPPNNRLQNLGNSLIAKCKLWLRYYISFCLSAALVSAFIFSHKLVYFAVVAVIITYFSSDYTLKRSAEYSTVQGGLSTTLEVFAICLSNVLGPLKIFISAGISYTIALVLLYLTASNKIPKSMFDMFNIIGMVLLALGEAGVKPFIGSYLAEQLIGHANGKDEHVNEDQLEARKKVWWSLAWFCSVVVAFLTLNFSWPKRLLFAALVMGGSLIIFMSGIKCYHCKKLTKIWNPFDVLRVVKAAMSKWRLNDPSSADQFFDAGGRNLSQLCVSPRVKLLRWLDKAAIKESAGALSPEEPRKAGRLCTVKQVKESKIILAMFPMWSSFLVFGLVLSAGKTFFPEQATNMQSHKFIVILFVLKGITRAMISHLSRLFILSLVPETKRRQAQVVRIWIGMVTSIFCCTVAWRVEVHKLQIVHTKGFIDQPDKTIIPMSIFWLAPQFSLLGVTEGLALPGLDKFLIDQFPKGTEDYLSALNSFVIGLESFINILFVNVNKKLFAQSLNLSRLDKYYMRLTIVCFINMCYNWYLATVYIQSETAKVEGGSDTTVEEKPGLIPILEDIISGVVPIFAKVGAHSERVPCPSVDWEELAKVDGGSDSTAEENPGSSSIMEEIIEEGVPSSEMLSTDGC